MRIFALTGERGVYLSEDGGRTWDSVNTGLPDRFSPLRIYSGPKSIYLTTRASGLFRFNDRSESWESLNIPDFLLRSQTGDQSGYRKISAFAVDPVDDNNITMTTKHTIYRSRDGGKTWIRVSTTGLHERNYITALSIKKDTICAGTSFNGFFQLKGGGFVRINSGLPQEPYSGTLAFTEELISITDTDAATYAGFRFGGGLYEKKKGTSTWKRVELPELKDRFFSVSDIGTAHDSLYIATEKKVYFSRDITGSWQTLDLDKIITGKPGSSAPQAFFIHDPSGNFPSLYIPMGAPFTDRHDHRADDRRTIYSSVPAIGKKLKSFIRTMQVSHLNAIVIDMKDDFGNIHYPSELATAKEIGALRRPVPVRNIIAELKKAGIYTIARIVVFKDEKLFKGYGSKYAIYDRKTGGPWRGSPREYWVDPHALFVQDYNISIARELEALGFDEIQFDYIRFPSDGPVWLCQFNHRKDPAMYKSEILTEFLRRAKKQLQIPVSVDIYGFNSWYSFGNWIGQDMEEFSCIVDAICPMVYPSHFGNRFYMRGRREDRSYRIVYDGGRRSLIIAGSGVAVRPYLQAFKMMSPTWGPGYIINQVKGAMDSGCSGYTFWNARGDYEMVERALNSAMANTD